MLLSQEIEVTGLLLVAPCYCRPVLAGLPTVTDSMACR